MENRTNVSGKPLQKNEDPRIDSPEIKVVYPAETVIRADKPMPPHPPALPLQKEETEAYKTVLSEVVPLINTTSRQTDQTVTNQSTSSSETTIKGTIWDAIKENKMGFFVIVSIVFALGYLLAKNK